MQMVSFFLIQKSCEFLKTTKSSKYVPRKSFMIRHDNRFYIFDKESYTWITNKLPLYFLSVITLFIRINTLSILCGFCRLLSPNETVKRRRYGKKRPNL